MLKRFINSHLPILPLFVFTLSNSWLHFEAQRCSTLKTFKIRYYEINIPLRQQLYYIWTNRQSDFLPADTDTLDITATIEALNASYERTGLTGIAGALMHQGDAASAGEGAFPQDRMAAAALDFWLPHWAGAFLGQRSRSAYASERCWLTATNLIIFEDLFLAGASDTAMRMGAKHDGTWQRVEKLRGELFHGFVWAVMSTWRGQHTESLVRDAIRMFSDSHAIGHGLVYAQLGRLDVAHPFRVASLDLSRISIHQLAAACPDEFCSTGVYHTYFHLGLPVLLSGIEAFCSTSYWPKICFAEYLLYTPLSILLTAPTTGASAWDGTLFRYLTQYGIRLCGVLQEIIDRLALICLTMRQALRRSCVLAVSSLHTSFANQSCPQGTASLAWCSEQFTRDAVLTCIEGHFDSFGYGFQPDFNSFHYGLKYVPPVHGDRKTLSSRVCAVQLIVDDPILSRACWLNFGNRSIRYHVSGADALNADYFGFI
jgi:hypothetical protein